MECTDRFKVRVAQKNSTHPFATLGFLFGYVINGEQGATLKLDVDGTYCFDINTPGHPFYFTTSGIGGTGFPESISSKRMEKGNLLFKPAEDLPQEILQKIVQNGSASFFYQCGIHTYMGGVIKVSSRSMNGIKLTLTPLIRDLSAPTALASHPNNADIIFIAEQRGQVWAYRSSDSLLWLCFDLSAQIERLGLNENYDERGLLGIAAHPELTLLAAEAVKSSKIRPNRMFVYYSTRAPRTTSFDHYGCLSEIPLDATGDAAAPLVGNLREERVLLRSGEPFSNHNSGNLVFGPKDGLLYIGRGDGGGAGDPGNNGQNGKTLLGSILRIDINSSLQNFPRYAIPEGNPASTKNWAPEVYVIGLRNPWGMQFDDEGERLFVADVGQNRREEVTIVRAAGENHGWRAYEGSLVYSNEDVRSDVDYVFPIFEYGRDVGICVIGGCYVSQRGIYICGEWTGKLFVLKEPENDSKSWPLLLTQSLPTDTFVRAFGKDAAGTLYVLTSKRRGIGGSSGIVHRINIK